jgi:DHA2 family multidrug resistance protein
MERRNFALAYLVNLVAGCGIFGGAYILPIFLDSVPHYTSYQVGLTLMSSGIGSALVMFYTCV